MLIGSNIMMVQHTVVAVCVYVCMFVRARVRVCVRACVCLFVYSICINYYIVTYVYHTAWLT